MSKIKYFDSITPCGECCDDCQHKLSGDCKGCRETDGKCIKMWSNGCEIYKCCLNHKVHFCGLCEEFPCQWLTAKICSWNPKGIDNLRNLAEQYCVIE